jgi:hypothetical protein
LAKLDLKPGASVEKLTIQNGEVFSGDVIDQFKDAEPFKLSICRGASGDVYVNYRRIGSRTPATTPLASITRRAQSTKAFRIVVSAPSSSAIA